MGANLDHARRQVEAAHKPISHDVHALGLAARKYGQVEVAEAVRAWARENFDAAEECVDWRSFDAILDTYDPPAPPPPSPATPAATPEPETKGPTT